MTSLSLSHLADHAVACGLASSIRDDRTTTATLLAYFAEADARKLYVPEGYASTYLYCVREFHMSEDVALKRIRVARVARRFPAIFDAISDGRLGLSSIIILVPYLSAGSAGELLVAAEHKTNADLELLLAERFPKPDLPTLVQEVAMPGDASTAAAPTSHVELAVRPVVPSNEPEPVLRMEPLSPRPKLAPLSPGRFAVQITLEQQEYEDLRRAQELLAHVLPSGDAARVIGRALRALVVMLEKRKFAKRAAKPDSRRQRRGSSKVRTIPAHVRRLVAERDDGRCTFVGSNGRRCEERKCLEFDHVVPVARGGENSVDGVRLRCRVHNQYEAEQVFGEGFMREKREDAQQRREHARAARAAAERAAAERAVAVQAVAERATAMQAVEARLAVERAAAERATAMQAVEARLAVERAAAERATAERAAAARVAAERAAEQDVTPWLRALGCNSAEARRAAAHCAHIPEAPLEERLRVALRTLAPKSARRVLPVTNTEPSLPT